MSNIDFDKMLSGNFIKLEPGVAKKLVLANWRNQTQFKNEDGTLKGGIVFDCYNEDGIILSGDKQKAYTVTAKNAIGLLRPIIEKAESLGQASIHVEIMREGTGKKTTYTVNEIVSAQAQEPSVQTEQVVQNQQPVQPAQPANQSPNQTGQ